VKIGITAGYHRLWAHRSYNASRPLQYFLALCGAGAVQGSIRWWARGHRAHHRYTDTDLDPYNAHKGLLWSHIGWMLLKPRRKPGVADISDLSKNDIVRWQHRYYLQLLLSMGIIVPTFVAGLGWGDWKGGYVYAGLLRLVFVHHVSAGKLCVECWLIGFHISSPPSALTRLPTGSEKHLSMTSIRPVTICSLPLSPLVRVTTTSITSSRWTTGTRSNGTSTIPRNGSYGPVSKLALPPTSRYSLRTRFARVSSPCS